MVNNLAVGQSQQGRYQLMTQMRKILFLAVFLVLAMVNTSFAGAVVSPQNRHVPDVFSVYGVVKEIRGNGVLVSPTDSKKGDIMANVSDNTYIYKDAQKEFSNVSGLKVGDKVTVYHSTAMTRSIPPQTAAFAIVVGEGVNVPRYYRVNEVSNVEKGTEFLTAAGSLIVRAKEVVDGLKAKDELLVWHGPVALSMPGQTNASKIINLSSMSKGKITLHTGAGVMAANGQEIQITQAKAKQGVYKVYMQNKMFMLPLEPLAKALGLEVVANKNTDRVTIKSGNEIVELELGSKKCKFAGNKIELQAAVKNKYDQIMVPADLFTKALNIKFELMTTPI